MIYWVLAASIVGAAEDVPNYDGAIAPLLKRHCVKCHGPIKQEGRLNLAGAGGIIRGGKTGVAVVPHDADASLVWQKIAADEMPPEKPLSADEKAAIKRWIVSGTPGLKRTEVAGDADHWAFRSLPRTATSPHAEAAMSQGRTTLDAFIEQNLSRDGLSLSPEADRWSLIRRVSLDVTGLPPTVEDIAEFLADRSPDAFERIVDRYLASPHFGERLGKVWLDAAGYADSNGYFSADSDRPLAYRYRDYVIRSLNADLPFDQFVREQIAGDQIADVSGKNGGTVELPSRKIEMLEATHYLRCGQDGSGESDGNPDEVRVDRYTVLETAMQNLSTGLLGLTIQCAKCHDHKFEPLTQRDYYQLQAVFIPAFPPEQWVKPNDRFVHASLPGEVEAWRDAVAKADSNVHTLSREISDWVKQNRPSGKVLFSDSFDTGEPLAKRWSATAPGDDQPGGTAAVNVDSREAPGAIVLDGHLNLFEGGPGGDKWLSTTQAFDWTPDTIGATIQVTFDLIDHRIGDSSPSERIGYLFALHDFHDNSSVAGGNILVDGHPSTGSAVFVDYPGNDARQVGSLGTTGYVPGRNYGVRITNQGGGKYLLQHLVDWHLEEKTITLTAEELPAGGFGFEFCCGRSFVVDNVIVETFEPSESSDPLGAFLKQLKSKREPLDAALKHKQSLGNALPGKIAWTTDVVNPPPQVHVLLRGNYKSPGDAVEPAGYAILGGAFHTNDASSLVAKRRLAFADWLTEADSPRSSLLARVHVNRIWQHHFGTGIVATPENFGVSGAAPSHPELLDALASRFVHSGWSTKHVVRQIICSSTYRQTSDCDKDRHRLDSDLRRLSCFPVRRLDAEAIRDSLLAASGDLNDQMFGLYIATSRTGGGETVVAENSTGSRRRSIYLQQKRTQVHSLLQVFDAPSIVFNSTRRARSTMPLQSLALMNSEFVRARAMSLASRIERVSDADADRIRHLFVMTTGKEARDEDVATAAAFLKEQAIEYGGTTEGTAHAWRDLCQAMLIGNASLYLE